MSTVIKKTNELIEELDLWIPFLEKKEKYELLKQAKITKMKLEGLEDAEIEQGELTAEQEVIWDICVKDIEYIQEKIQIIRIEDNNTIH